MVQYTQPVVGQQQQQQSSPPQQHQQQQQTQNTTTQTPNNTNTNTMNNNNNNNNNPAPTTPTAGAAPPQAVAVTTNNNNQTQTVAVAPPTAQPVANAGNNNNYATTQNTIPGVVGIAGAPVYNPQLHAANMYVPAGHHGMSGHHHPHHPPGAMYSTMIPAPLSSNVFVNNVTANVNLHGWPHTAVPHGGWVHPAGAPHYIHGEIPPEQGAPVLQPMAVPMALPPTGQIINTHSGGGGGGGGGRGGSRRGRGRGGGSGSRRNDYNSQRHTPQQQHHHHQQQQQHEGSPAPPGAVVQSTNQQQSQEQQTMESQQIMSSIPYAHPQGTYAAHAPQYPYGYPAYFAPQQPMIHAGQNPGAQQGPGTPLYFSQMPVYNNPPIYNYGYFIPSVVNQAEYPYMPAEEVMAGQVADERQAGGEASTMIWHQPHMYPGDEYGMNPNEMHSIAASDDINQNAGSAAETPTSMLSPNYTPIYDPQMHEMQQQMGVMQIYEDPQMGQIQVMHPQGTTSAAGGGVGVPQIDDDISECGSQPSAPIQMVPAGAIITAAPGMAAAAPPPLQQNQISEQLTMHQQQQPHIIPVAGNVVMSIDQTTSTNQQQQPLSSDNNVHVDSTGMQANEYGTGNNNTMQPCESITNLNEENSQQQQQLIENVGQDYQQQPIQTAETSTAPIQMDNYNNTGNNNKNLMTDVHELQDNVTKQTHIITNTTTTTVTNVDVAIETNTIQQNIVQQQQMSQTFVAATQTQSVPQQQVQPQQQTQNYKQQHQQQYQHQQLQTQQPQQQTQSQSNQHHQQQHHHSQQQQSHYHNYDNRKSSQSSYGGNQQQQQQSRRNKYDHHNDQQQHQQQQQPTTKTMSWTNSSQHKKSTNTVAVTATPSSSHNPGYNKQSNSSINSSSTSTHSHGTRTYTNQQHHSYQQQQQTTQTRNYGAMKMPSSPVATGPGATNSSNTERKHSQSSDHAGGNKPHQATASTTATPHQFQQSSATNEGGNAAASKQQRKQSLVQQQQQQVASPNTTTGTNTTPSATTNDTSTPPINLAPPASASAQAAPSTPSWASLFTASASPAASASPSTAAANQNSTPNNNTLSNTTSSASTNTTANYAQKPIAKVAPFESVASTATPVVTPGALSYSAASAQNLPTPPSSTTNNNNNSNSSAMAAGAAGGSRKITNLANLDEYSLKFAEFLTKYKSDWTTISLRPRGLTNRSNYCYINSILQALLGCSPLYNLMRSIPKQAANLCEVKTPTVNAMMSFMSNFSNLPSGLRLRTAKGGKGNNKDDLAQELQCDPAFEPTEIYKLWNDSREEHVEGRQEDAEEFLSYILNKLNDEMLEVVKLIAKPNAEQNGQNDQSEGEDGDVWQMICNNRNKGSVTRQTDFGCTPLSDIFRGELRSRLQREGEHPTDVIQPFLTLPLNIEKAASVKEALEILVGRDQLEGVTGSKSKQEVLAWQQMNVEKLPPILILHLKWFDYRSDGCTKILKKVEFPVDLKIDAKILASKKYSQKQRAYRLFAVVYHDGKEASKGHYITDVYHTGYGSWLRYDDSSVKSVSENHVLLPRTPRVPYLLYYRRCDTIPQQNNNSNNSGGGNSSSGGNNASGGHNTPK